MRFDILTIFPEIFESYFQESIIKRALESHAIEIVVHDIRPFSLDRHHKVDAPPYGGGPGMVMMPQPLCDAIEYVKTLNAGPVLYMSPRGNVLTQNKVLRLVKKAGSTGVKGKKNQSLQAPDIHGTVLENKVPTTSPCKSQAPTPGLILLCGRYEGIDQRVIDLLVDEEISIGKYVLTGGELAAMVIIDAVSRYVPGVLGDEMSHEEESFSKALKGKKEYPHYTRPEIFRDVKVPDVLLSGHHAKIKKWREENVR